ncbi:fatty acid desaturase family protein [Pseudochrobactrum kiredjianiae]|uniref:Fatty acid desaturase n=1 Tax=Pseudochrobactrum kiredjianiae TaxID=386305 RepID=A0ABW3V0C3_9HYPH|nr:fatty acid desaturase family protein [Pseudochrobactrum kiredjianiae]MDM7852831.1 fatty acid desaturase family protein [Pseudochrobactrum kiredjianiae]
MHQDFLKPSLSIEQKKRIKNLYKRDNYHGFIALWQDIIWISIAITLPILLSFWLYPLSVLIIGARQRALASLLHEAAHGTLFKKHFLNTSIGRLICGWTILQSFGAYKQSHVLNHHSKIGEEVDDPDLRYMIAESVYVEQSRSVFIGRYVLGPILGTRTIKYIWFLLKDRLIGPLQIRDHRVETIAVVSFHAILSILMYQLNALSYFVLYWWIPFVIVYPIIGWFSELSEHFPMMKSSSVDPSYSSRNRYASPVEAFFIGTHGDNYHLTHHLLPGIPHWNLKKATTILREHEEFRIWDDIWGGIFTSGHPSRISLLDYIINYHTFRPANTHVMSSYAEMTI